MVKNISDRVMVMYKGHIVEENSTREIFERPKNNYTKELLASIPGYESNFIWQQPRREQV